jgi:NitT/TauT family transport system permease protein
MLIGGYRIPAMASLVVWAIVWEIVGRADLTLLIPPLSATLVRLAEIAGTESFWEAVGITARTFAAGSAVAILLTVVLFAIWIVILDARAGTQSISPSLVEMARVYGASRWQAFSKIYVLSALPEILTGIRLGLLRAVKGVIIGQLLVSVVGFGRLFEIYSSNFLMEHMWAMLIVLFGLAFVIDTLLGAIERRVDYFAGSRN